MDTLFEFAPINGPIPRHASDEYHVCWWEVEDGRLMIETSPFLRAIRRVNKPFSVMLDWDGEVVR
jgi:hypothetical protein